MISKFYTLKFLRNLDELTGVFSLKEGKELRQGPEEGSI